MDFDPNRLGRQGDQISFGRGLLIFFDVAIAVDQISFAGADLSVISGKIFLDDMFGDNFSFGVFLESISDIRSWRHVDSDEVGVMLNNFGGKTEIFHIFLHSMLIFTRVNHLVGPSELQFLFYS